MIFCETPLAGPTVIELERHEDERGFFARTWCAREFDAHGLISRIAQMNTSLTRRRGTIRGMHMQVGPHAEAKVVRCVRGRVFDVAVDARPDSPDFGRWVSVDLDERSGQALYVPAGFAHGFQTLDDDVVLLYAVSEFHTPESEVGFHYADRDVGIDWPLEVTSVSERDAGLPPISALLEGNS